MSKQGFVGVNGVAKKISNLWVGDSNNVARKVVRAWVGDEQGKARLWWDRSLHYDYEGDYITVRIAPDFSYNSVSSYSRNTMYYIDSNTGYGFFMTYLLNDNDYKYSTGKLVVWRIYYNKNTDIVTLGPYSMDTVQYCPSGATTSNNSDNFGGTILDQDSFYVIEGNKVFRYYYFWNGEFVYSDITAADISIDLSYYPISATSINGYVIVFFISSQSCISALFRKDGYKLIFCSYTSSSLTTYHYTPSSSSTLRCGLASLGVCFIANNNENTVRALFGYGNPWELFTFTIDYHSETLTEIFHTTFSFTSRGEYYIKGFIDFNHFYFIDRSSTSQNPTYVGIPSINDNGEIVTDYFTGYQNVKSIWGGVIAYLNGNECVAIAAPLNGGFSQNGDLALRRFDYNTIGLVATNSNVICSVPNVSKIIGSRDSRSYSSMQGSIINNKYIYIWSYTGTAMYGQIGASKDHCFYMSAFNYSYTDAYVIPLRYTVNVNHVDCISVSDLGE